jgi:hypothetical protein
MTRQEEQNDVLKDFAGRLEKLSIDYMLTGSMALVHYAMPRTTVDIDVVLSIGLQDVTRFVSEFEEDYYIPKNRVEDSIRRSRMFNILNQKAIIKVDCVIKKNDPFQQSAFERRRRVNYAGYFDVWIITKEDLVLSKSLWARESRSEMQMRDIASIIRNPHDEDYIRAWAQKLDVTDILQECRGLLEKNYVDGHDA